MATRQGAASGAGGGMFSHAIDGSHEKVEHQAGQGAGRDIVGQRGAEHDEQDGPAPGDHAVQDARGGCARRGAATEAPEIERDNGKAQELSLIHI